MATATQILANANYRAKAYDVISTSVKKGKRDEYNAAAKELKLSLAMLIQNGVEEYIKNHTGEDFTAAIKPEAEKLTSEQKRLVEEFNQLPADAQKYLIKFVRAINDQSKGGGDNGGN